MILVISLSIFKQTGFCYSLAKQRFRPAGLFELLYFRRPILPRQFLSFGIPVPLPDLLLMKKTFLFAFLLAPLFAFSQNYNGPESVDCDTVSGNWYIANTGSKKILRRTPQGVLQEFISGFSSGPYGIEVVGERIYACDGNKIKGFLLSDGAPVFSITTNATFLNGITHDTSGVLYATDFSGKKIYKVNPVTAAWSVFVPQTTTTPNGILYDQAQNRLVCVCWGSNAKILGIALADSSVSILKTTALSNIDGLARDGSGRWYVASWGANAVHRINPDFSGTPEQVLSGMNHPADIYYNLQTDTLAIPNAGNNTVVFAGFAPVSATREPENVAQLQAFPNPVVDVLSVKLPENWKGSKTIFRIIASNGQEYLVPLIQNENLQKSFSVQKLPAGLYQLLATEGGETARSTFLKN